MKINPHSTAFLAVHMQGDVVTRDGAFGDFFADMVERHDIIATAADLLAAARAAGATVAYTRIVFSEGHSELVVNAPIWGVVEQTKCMVDGTPGAAIVAELAAQEGDLVVDHHRVDGSFESGLVAGLRDRGVDTVVLFGVSTNVSVEATARGLADHGFRVAVVADASTAADQAAHDASIATLGLLASEVVSADDVRSALGTEVTQ